MTLQISDHDSTMAESLPYFITFGIDSLLFIFALVIFLHFSFKTYGLDISQTIRYFALCASLVVLMSQCLELWTTLVDSSTGWPQTSALYCYFEIYARLISFILFDCILFVFWTIRLKHTFYGSVLALSNTFLRCLLVCITLFMLTFCVVLAWSIQPRYYTIDASVTKHMAYGVGCTTEINLGVYIFFIGAQTVSIAFHIFFGVLFWYKLKKYIKLVFYYPVEDNNTTAEERQRYNAVKFLMLKHTLLAIVTVISGITAYLALDIFLVSLTALDNLNYLQYAFLCIDADMLIKTLSCFLMFKFYEYHFYRLCCCCIRIAVIPCRCCTVDAEIDAEHSVFEPLTSPRVRASPRGAYEDKWGEDRMPLASQAPNTNQLQLRSDDAQPLQFLDADQLDSNHSIADYKFCTLLVKVCVNEKKVKTRVFQYAMRNEKIDNDDNIFTQIENAETADSAEFGYLLHYDDAAAGTSMATTNAKIYFARNMRCKWPFVVAVKLVAAQERDQDGECVVRYVSQRMQHTLDHVTDITGYAYEPLLEEMVSNIRLKNVDLPFMVNNGNQQQQDNHESVPYHVAMQIHHNDSDVECTKYVRES